MIVPQPGQRGGKAKSTNQFPAVLNGDTSACMSVLSPRLAHRTSSLVSAPMFDHRLRALRRDRAARIGIETFLYDRAFDDCLDRLNDIRGDFTDILLAGCPNPNWAMRMGDGRVQVIDPGPLIAARAGGRIADLESLPFDGGSFDLCLSVGLLDTANDLALAAAALHFVLKPRGLLLGAIVGGQSLPRLRQAMLAADQIAGQASAHVHPRIDAGGLAQLLTQAGFAMPVVDIDRVELSYSSLGALVRDLRAMGATNILSARSRRSISSAGVNAARTAFTESHERTTELVEVLHFAGWKFD